MTPHFMREHVRLQLLFRPLVGAFDEAVDKVG